MKRGRSIGVPCTHNDLNNGYNSGIPQRRAIFSCEPETFVVGRQITQLATVINISLVLSGFTYLGSNNIYSLFLSKSDAGSGVAACRLLALPFVLCVFIGPWSYNCDVPTLRMSSAIWFWFCGNYSCPMAYLHAPGGHLILRFLSLRSQKVFGL
ncbi:hypothetical protein CDAR_309841 [Caerostris darwini]|uniref:Uncharacterized protein n=1 Tax=Caerostris darwini TaxID=1538125 RepID=A0AAV4VYA6_9ARAC|nr:hypothetical protein CDAR_309841 [Caerostris darwini]